MNEEAGFFNVDISDELVESLDDIAYGQLLDVLQLNFQQEYAHLSALNAHNDGLVQEIATGEANLAKLASLSQEHHRQKLKIRSELELLTAECEAAKEELKK
jgi:hypothetical protein